MDSPHTSKRSVNEGDRILLKVNCTPKNYGKSSLTGEEFSLYNLHKESSPNFQAGQDVLEVGWGDSPEPLQSKFELNRTPVTCKKKLETKESPKSSNPSKRRNIRTSFRVSSKSVVDIAKYVAEVQELSKNIMKELNAQKVDKNLSSEDENIVQRDPSPNPTNDEGQRKAPEFDNVLESFINEEDDWLSQALSSQEQLKTPLKGNFVKSKSENELSTDAERINLTQKSWNINNNNNNSFRRASSFDSPKAYKDFSLNGVKDMKQRSSAQYSFQEIERKRLEAKYRKERREIERKKLEALKKLEMKKLRMVKAKPSVIEIMNKVV